MKLFLPEASIAIRMREEASPPMRKGEEVPGHDHEFGHPTFITNGGFRFDALGDQDRVLRSAEVWNTSRFPFIIIPARVRHRLTALEDGSRYWCAYAHHEPEYGALVMESVGWMPSYE